MRSEGISARNRANAQKSTGPTSAQGKATVAQNARRHGVTAKPDPTSVAVWMRIILDKPILVPADLLRDDGQTSSALALAEAEVKLCAALATLDQFEHADTPLTDTSRDFQFQAKNITDALLTEDLTARLRCTGLSLLRRIAKDITAKTAHGGKRHKLLQRYAVRRAGTAREHFRPGFSI